MYKVSNTEIRGRDWHDYSCDFYGAVYFVQSMLSIKHKKTLEQEAVPIPDRVIQNLWGSYKLQEIDA